MITADVARAAVADPEPTVEFTADRPSEPTLEPRDERTFEVPVRLAMVPVGRLTLAPISFRHSFDGRPTPASAGVVRIQARMRRLAISPSIWRSAST